MKYLIIVALLLCCSVAWAECNHECIKNMEPRYRCLKCGEWVSSNHTIEKEIKEMHEELSKIYSMLADIHIKEMGQERYNQIYDPTNEGEVAKQEKWDKSRMRELADAINSYIESGEQIEVVVK